MVAALKRKALTPVSLNLPRIAGWAAAVMVLINISMFTTRQLSDVYF
jgi:hypothetical protein